MRKKTSTKSSKKSPYEILFNIDRFYIFPYYFADISFTSSVKNAVGGNLSRIFVEFNQDHVDYYMNLKEIIRVGRNLFRRVFKDESYYKKSAKIYFGIWRGAFRFLPKN